MSRGEEFRRELRRALADLHRQQRRQRGRRAANAKHASHFGRAGYRRHAAWPNDKPSSGHPKEEDGNGGA